MRRSLAFIWVILGALSVASQSVKNGSVPTDLDAFGPTLERNGTYSWNSFHFRVFDLRLKDCRMEFKTETRVSRETMLPDTPSPMRDQTGSLREQRYQSSVYIDLAEINPSEIELRPDVASRFRMILKTIDGDHVIRYRQSFPDGATIERSERSFVIAVRKKEAADIRRTLIGIVRNCQS